MPYAHMLRRVYATILSRCCYASHVAAPSRISDFFFDADVLLRAATQRPRCYATPVFQGEHGARQRIGGYADAASIRFRLQFYAALPPFRHAMSPHAAVETRLRYAYATMLSPMLLIPRRQRLRHSTPPARYRYAAIVAAAHISARCRRLICRARVMPRCRCELRLMPCRRLRACCLLSAMPCA